MVPLRDMTDDYYEYDDAGHRVIGRATGKQYLLGESVRVIIVRADKLSREIDMSFAG